MATTQPAGLQPTTTAFRLPGPLAPLMCGFHHRELVMQMARKEVVSRYRGSAMGVLWSLLTPLLMLGVFTLVFGYALGSRWGGNAVAAESKSEFAVILFAGLIVFWLFSDCIGRAPGLLLEHPDFIRRRVFPVEVLPVVTLVGAGFHFAVSLAVLLVAQTIVFGPPPITALWVPVVIAPFGLAILGLCWILSALGVFLRDIGHVVGVVVSAAIFLSPAFYPLSVFPEPIQPLLYLNPVTFVMTELRTVVLVGAEPSWAPLAMYGIVSWATAWLGYAWFTKARSAFADVV